MKLSASEELSLQKYLKSKLRYRETYAEFYDHILTALENTPPGTPFNDAVMQIITDDFGGLEGMSLIEDKYKNLTFKELKNRYLHYAGYNFRFPGIFITAALVVFIYFLCKQPWFGLDTFLLNILAIRVMPSVIYMITHLRSFSFYGRPRQSIKNSFFKWQNAIPGFVFFIAWTVAAAGPVKDQPWMQQIILPTMVTIMALMSLHSLTYYRVFRDDIQAAFTVNKS